MDVNGPNEQGVFLGQWISHYLHVDLGQGVFLAALAFSILLTVWIFKDRDFWTSFNVGTGLSVGLVICAFCGAVLVKITAVPALLQLGNFALGLGLGAIFPLMLTAAMDLDSDNGPVLSGLANIGILS